MSESGEEQPKVIRKSWSDKVAYASELQRLREEEEEGKHKEEEQAKEEEGAVAATRPFKWEIGQKGHERAKSLSTMEKPPNAAGSERRSLRNVEDKPLKTEKGDKKLQRVVDAIANVKRSGLNTMQELQDQIDESDSMVEELHRKTQDQIAALKKSFAAHEGERTSRCIC